MSDVVADGEALVVRLAATESEESDALMYGSAPGLEYLRGVNDPHEARRLLLQARDAGCRTGTGARTGRTPSPAIVVAVVGALAFLCGLVAGLP